jgi:ketosteroid isomerase-like protein
MSHENVELVCSYYEALNRRDLDAFELLAPEIEFHLTGVFPDLKPVYRGRAAVRSFFEQFTEPWEELMIEPARVIDVEERVLVLLRFHARGRDGIEVELPLAHLWTLRSGRAVRMDAYSDQEEALETVGLSE